MINLRLRHSDVCSVASTNNDIKLPIQFFRAPFVEHTPVAIEYVDEPRTIEEYLIYDISDDFVYLMWLKTLTTDILTEANPIKKIQDKVSQINLDKKVAKGIKKLDKEELKFKKLIQRDLEDNASNWKFYLPNRKRPVNQLAFKELCQVDESNKDPVLSDAVLNTTVVDDNGKLIRQGKTDYSKNNLKFTPAMLDKESTEKEVNKDIKSSSVTTSDSTKLTDSKIDKFKKLVELTGLKVYTSHNELVDDVNQLDLSSDNLKNYIVKINDREVSLDKWLEVVMKNKIITEKLLKESPEVTLDAVDLIDPSSISLRNKLNTAIETEKEEKRLAAIEARNSEYRRKFSSLLKVFEDNTKGDVEKLEDLFQSLVPESGSCETLGGELVRAMMRILYRDLNDGDKFFEGYGIETCGSSAEFLFDNGLSEEINKILEDAYRLEDDTAYTKAIENLCSSLISYLKNNPEVLWEPNSEDSRNYFTDYIEENQPRYEFELYGSDDIHTLVENDVLNSWDLNSYVENVLSYDSVYNDAEVDRPWTHHDTSVTVSNLTKDAYDFLSDSFRDVDGFWMDLVSEYQDELEASEDEDDDEEYED